MAVNSSFHLLRLLQGSFNFNFLGFWASELLDLLYGSFRRLGVPYFGVLIVRILLFRVLYLRPPIFGNSHMFQSVTSWKDTAGVVGTQVSDLRDGL